MVAVSDLLRPRSVAVVGANDDRDTFGGRIWHYLGEYSDIERMAVNARPGAFKDTTVASSLSELAHRPDLVVLATPAKTILGLVADAASVGAKAALVFSQVPPEVRGKLRQLVDDAGLTLLGPGSLGLINATDGVILSSSVSLERAPRSGPLALVAQSGALMGVLHASAGEQGIGLGLCVATGSQLQVRVEHLLAALGTDGEYLAVGAHLEDIDVDLFVDAAKSIVGTGRKLVVLKGGLTSPGNVAAAGHSGALAGDGRAFQSLARDLGVVVASHPAELLACMHAATLAGKNWCFATVSGGLAAIAGDLASGAGLGLAPSSPDRQVFPPGNERIEHTNPVDIDAVPMTTAESVAAIAALAKDPCSDGVILVINDKPDLDGLLSGLSCSTEIEKARLHLCSECSGHFDDAWRAWVDEGGTYTKGLSSFVQALASTRERSGPPDRGLAPKGQLMGDVTAHDFLAAAGIPALGLVEVGSLEALELAMAELRFPFVLKLAGAEHRGATGVVTVTDAATARAEFQRLACLGGVVAQQLASPGLEFYVGITFDEVFGPLFLIGAGGPTLEKDQDISMTIGLPDRDAIWRCLGETHIGRWLISSLGSALVDLEKLVDVAEKAVDVVRKSGGSLVALDLNPVVLGPTGAVVVDAKLHAKLAIVREGEETT
jgi:acyl-CoA synthetase (NDP forming)